MEHRAPADPFRIAEDTASAALAALAAFFFFWQKRRPKLPTAAHYAAVTQSDCKRHLVSLVAGRWCRYLVPHRAAGPAPHVIAVNEDLEGPLTDLP